MAQVPCKLWIIEEVLEIIDAAGLEDVDAGIIVENLFIIKKPNYNPCMIFP